MKKNINECHGEGDKSLLKRKSVRLLRSWRHGVLAMKGLLWWRWSWRAERLYAANIRKRWGGGEENSNITEGFKKGKGKRNIITYVSFDPTSSRLIVHKQLSLPLLLPELPLRALPAHVRTRAHVAFVRWTYKRWWAIARGTIMPQLNKTLWMPSQDSPSLHGCRCRYMY